jgi:WD40 repeat protein
LAWISADAVPVGPLIDPGLRPGVTKTIAISDDESTLFTAGSGDISRFWSMTAVSAAAAQEGPLPSGQLSWRESGAIVSAIAPGGGRMAFGDRSGHVHIEQVAAVAAPPPSENEEISFVGHRDAVRSIVFSPDGELVASIGADRTLRVWDAGSGLPRSYYGKVPFNDVERMAFSPSGEIVAVLGGQRMWLMSVADGMELASVELGENHADLVFSSDDQIFVARSNGGLQRLFSDRTGNWHLGNVWQGDNRIRRLAYGITRNQLVIVDDSQMAMVLDPENGSVKSDTLQLPGPVNDVAFSPNESRVLFRSGRWVHRALVTPTGLIWTDSLRAPKSLGGSAMVFESLDTGLGDPSGDSLLLLTRATGLVALEELRFGYSTGSSLIGNRADLLNEWIGRLRGSADSEFTREGF